MSYLENVGFGSQVPPPPSMALQPNLGLGLFNQTLNLWAFQRVFSFLCILSD